MSNHLLRSLLSTPHSVPFTLKNAMPANVTSIKYQDCLRFTDKFIEDLVTTIPDYVYTARELESLKEGFVSSGMSSFAAGAQIYRQACQRFRKSSRRGQLGELLAYSFIDHYFGAIPFVRKMKITTNPEMERNGADAIHFKLNDDGGELYIGECKTKGDFNDGFWECLTDAHEHGSKIFSEFDRYHQDGLLPEEVREYAKAFLTGSRKFSINFVCILTYEESDAVIATPKDSKLIEKAIERSNRIRLATFKSYGKEELLLRSHIIIFPISELDKMIERFEKEF